MPANGIVAQKDDNSIGKIINNLVDMRRERIQSDYTQPTPLKDQPGAGCCASVSFLAPK
jgi:hypothetical protein